MLKIILSIVKYLSTKFSNSSFAKIPNLGAFLEHNNAKSWAKPMD
jgi:hypothetical protein